jgi:septal ring factor EnvC (AmiA/AmiB activator)
MDSMQLAQMKRTLEWQTQEVRHTQQELNSAELALEGAKKKVDELHKKLVEGKRKQEQMSHDVAQAEKEVREKQFKERRA